MDAETAMSQEQIRIRELETALEANRTLLVLESEKVRRIQHQFVCIGQELGGEQFDQWLKDHLENDSSPEELAAEIVSIVKASLGFVRSNPDAQQISKLTRDVEECRSQLDIQTKRAMNAETQTAESKNQAASFEKSMAEARQKIQELEAALRAIKTPSAPKNYSLWFQEWVENKDYESPRNVLRFIGKTGLARVKQIEDAMLEQEGMIPRTIARGVDHCCDQGLLGLKGGQSLRGRPTNYVWLTEKGQWTYTKLTNAIPAISEYESLIKAYQTDLQASLVLRTADLFTHLGFAVIIKPNKIKIDENRYFWPDLIASKDGETFYLEVETGQEDDRSSLSRKWENALVVGGGRICLVTRKIGPMNAIQSQIIHWATEDGKKCRLYVTNIEVLKQVKPGESPWARIREI
jgi:hypothetical protein